MSEKCHKSLDNYFLILDVTVMVMFACVCVVDFNVGCVIWCI